MEIIYIRENVLRIRLASDSLMICTTYLVGGVLVHGRAG